MTDLLDLPQLTVAGSRRRLGHEQGEAFREKIESFVEQRLEALSQSLGERGRRSGVADFLALGEACLEAARVWDPEGTEEHIAIAEAARVPAATLYATSNMTDVRDVLLYSAGADSEGCTACLLPANLTERQGILVAQTWDLNPSDLDYVVAIRRRPENGPESVSITCVGCLSLVGMNEHGLSVGTTNIKSKDVQIGVGYLSLIHRAFRY